MLTPSARVSVANTALTSPSTKSFSTTSLKVGSMPAWWAASPRSSPSRQLQKPRTSRSSEGMSCAGLVDAPGNDELFLLGGQPQPGGDALRHGGVAARAGEDEGDGGQQVLPVEAGDDLRAAGLPDRAARAGLLGVVALVPLAPLVAAAVAEPSAEVHLALGACHGQQLGIDLEAGPVAEVRPSARWRTAADVRGPGPGGRGDFVEGGVAGEEVHDLPAHHHVLPERHRPVLGHDDVGLAAHGVQPRAEFLGVGDGGAERGHLDFAGQVDDDLFPDGAAEAVRQVVDLVHDHEAEVGQGAGIGVEHVAEHLGGHHHHRGVAVDAGVAGQQPHPVRAVLVRQFGVLLVAQGLDGGGVERLEAALQGQVDGELPHDRLAGTGGGGHQDTPAGLQ